MRMKTLIVPLALAGLALALVPASHGEGTTAAATGGGSDAERIAIGYRIAPVSLNLRHRDRNLVGLGSYIVNAQGGCNDCHTNPPYAAGGDPYQGQPKKFNAERYLAGGTPFGPVISRNITPNDDGLPAGLSLAEFKNVMRTGHDPDAPGRLLQVMPWPVYQSMTDNDLRAVYEYLRAIPHLEGGE
ncbi:MAG TPA: cytochrome C [Thermoanaerobaculia bacterium]|nr:cytochrome C [Thermoanaerobaculia bacterium]